MTLAFLCVCVCEIVQTVENIYKYVYILCLNIYYIFSDNNYVRFSVVYLCVFLFWLVGWLVGGCVKVRRDKFKTTIQKHKLIKVKISTTDQH